MAVTLTPLLTTVNSADASTGWTGDVAMSADADLYVEGTSSLSAVVRSASTRAFYYAAPSQPLNITGRHIYAWVYSTTGKYLDTYANGGMRIYVRDNANVWGAWSVAGRA